jgi:SAM-dependent methyltransferase
MALSSIWASLPGERLMGLGYAAPYLDRFRPDAERTFAFMPAGQGAVNWPAGGPSATALVFDEELPLADASLDRILMVHSLEFAENPRETLKELWRVLAPGGRLVIVAPNRRGVWARFEHTPFGAGRPYSRGQLVRHSAREQFHARAFAEALFFPPSRAGGDHAHARVFERFGRRMWPVFSGVIVVEAQKRLYQGLPVAQRAPRGGCSFRCCRRRHRAPRIDRRLTPPSRVWVPSLDKIAARGYFRLDVLTLDRPHARKLFR